MEQRDASQPLPKRIARPMGGALGPTIGLLLFLVFSVEAVRLAVGKRYGIDEFTYAHAAWLISNGQVPYRDFFCHHFPFPFYLMAVPFRFLDDNPNHIRYLRLMMLMFLAVILAATSRVNRREGQWTALITSLTLLMVPAVVAPAIEIRPDAIALAFFLAAVAVLYTREAARRTGGLPESDVSLPVAHDRWPPRIGCRKGLGSGMLFGLAICASEKVLCYGAVFAAAWAMDVFYNRKRKADYLLGNPFTFLAGVGVVAVSACVFLTLSGAWGSFVRYSLQWSAAYQQLHHGFTWQRYFWWIISGIWWLWGFAVVGLGATAGRLVRAGPARWSDPDWLLIGALPGAFASYALQRCAYPYSLLPAMTVMCIFSARGLALTVQALAEEREMKRSSTLAVVLLFLGLLVWEIRQERFEGILGVLAVASLPFVADRLGWMQRRPGLARSEHLLVFFCFVLLLSWQVSLHFSRLEEQLLTDNAYQHETLTLLNELTSPEDAVYDNSGGFVARPHTSFYYFTNSFIRRRMKRDLQESALEGIYRTGCAVFLHDIRFATLPEPLRGFLTENYQPLNPDIWIWGRHYETTTGTLSKRFYAIRDGWYFVIPGSVAIEGKLAFDDVAATGSIFPLTRGMKHLRYEGPPASFYILWLPRNGQVFMPSHRGQPKFSSLF